MLGTPKIRPQSAGKDVWGPGGPWRPQEAPGGPAQDFAGALWEALEAAKRHPGGLLGIGTPARRFLGGLEALRPLEAPGGPGGPAGPEPVFVEGSGGPLSPSANPPASSPWKEQEDDLFEVGIEGVALNPNRK